LSDYQKFDTEEKIYVTIINTKKFSGHISGYGRPIHMEIAVNGDGSIRDVRIIESQETPEYVQKIGAWLDQFKQMNINKDFPLAASRVDAVTSATDTCEAILNIINETVVKYNREISGKPESKEQPVARRITTRGSRSLDQQKLMKAIEQGELSNKEALFYKTFGDENDENR